jgi:hypothetical protein
MHSDADLPADAGGVATDTGSAVHAAVEWWHATGDADALAKIRGTLGAKFPRADWDDAGRFVTPYTLDPRNAPASVERCEVPVALTLPAADNDPTGESIRIAGTLDQLRRDADGVLQVWDVKTSRTVGGWVLLHNHAIQLAAYTLAAAQTLREQVEPGGIIRAYGYRVRGAAGPETSPDGIFFHASWNSSSSLLLLDAVRTAVAVVRSGKPLPGPGEWCQWCPLGGLENCLLRARASSLAVTP